MITVEMEDYEYRFCVRVGLLRRRTTGSHSRLTNAYGPPVSDAKLDEYDILGACSELVVARHKNRYPTGLLFSLAKVSPPQGMADVGDNIQVRATPREDGSLIVHDQDPNDHVFYLVTGTPPVLTIRGWMIGGDAKQEDWKRNPHNKIPSYFVPQEALNEE